MKFTKPALSIDDQLVLLRSRGMVIADEPTARHYLTHISYYRLRAYWIPFEGPVPAAGGHIFIPGTTFEDVLALYVFDRHLRLLVLDAIERVEVALRAAWAHQVALSHGPHGHIDPAHHHNHDFHANSIDDLWKEIDRSNDLFISHYRRTYNDPVLPPVWMAAEIISLGVLSRWIDNIKARQVRKAISDPFGIDESVLVSFAHHVSTVRNTAAHHGSLWNRRFTVTMKVPSYPAKLTIPMRDADSRKLHNTLVMLDHLLSVVAPENEWRKRVVELINGCPQVNPALMGFPPNWQSLAAWKVNYVRYEPS